MSPFDSGVTTMFFFGQLYFTLAVAFALGLSKTKADVVLIIISPAVVGSLTIYNRIADEFELSDSSREILSRAIVTPMFIAYFVVIWWSVYTLLETANPMFILVTIWLAIGVPGVLGSDGSLLDLLAKAVELDNKDKDGENLQ